MRIRRFYLRIIRTFLHLLYPAKVNSTGHLSEEHITERILLKNQETLRLPDDGNGVKEVSLNKKEIRVLSNVTFWPSLSIVQVDKNTLDAESELDGNKTRSNIKPKAWTLLSYIKKWTAISHLLIVHLDGETIIIGSAKVYLVFGVYIILS